MIDLNAPAHSPLQQIQSWWPFQDRFGWLLMKIIYKYYQIAIEQRYVSAPGRAVQICQHANRNARYSLTCLREDIGHEDEVE